jgi:hypothetical protein
VIHLQLLLHVQEDEWTQEKERLKAKLASGLVSGVWLQMGTDLNRLQDGLSFLQNEFSGLSDVDEPELYGANCIPLWTQQQTCMLSNISAFENKSRGFSSLTELELRTSLTYEFSVQFPGEGQMKLAGRASRSNRFCCTLCNLRQNT